jgi:hypothetical protein
MRELCTLVLPIASKTRKPSLTRSSISAAPAHAGYGPALARAVEQMLDQDSRRVLTRTQEGTPSPRGEPEPETDSDSVCTSEDLSGSPQISGDQGHHAPSLTCTSATPTSRASPPAGRT